MENGPREKLLNEGITSLKDDELLALLINTGRKGENVLELSNRILTELSSLNNISDLDVKDLIRIDGLGVAKASRIVASFELYRRIITNSLNKIQILSPINIYNNVRKYYIGETIEIAYIMFLDASRYLINIREIGRGTNDKLLIDENEIIRRAIILKAKYIVLIHNHPSGSLIPSNEDIYLTELIEEKMSFFGISLFDHLIVTLNGYYSMKFDIRKIFDE